MKNTFSLVSTYISWSSLSLPTPRMRKANESYMVSATHPLVTWHSYRLLRFSSCCYVTKGVIFIGWPPLRGDRRCPRGGHSSPRWSLVCPAERQQCFAMSTLRARQALSLDCWLHSGGCVSFLTTTSQRAIALHPPLAYATASVSGIVSLRGACGRQGRRWHEEFDVWWKTV